MLPNSLNNPLDVEDLFDDELLQDKEIRNLKHKLKLVSTKYQTALDTISKLEVALKTTLDIQAVIKKQQAVKLTSLVGEGPPEAIPILLWSDWHVGEMVDPATVNHKNSYNPDICQERANKLFCNTADMINMLKSRYTINNLIVWLGGDFVTGYIHAELMESNAMAPTQECLFVSSLIKSGLNYLIENTGVSNVIVPCSFGNHGRLTDHIRISTGHVNNIEWFMYQTLAEQYKLHDKITFYISDGHVMYMEVWGKMLRFTHGDAIRYGGGTNGVAVPISKWISKHDQIEPADMTFLGHFHNTCFDKRFTVNNCLIGATPYSARLGFPVEPPDQSLVLLEKEKGFTLRVAIAAE
jgi:hypothetical protein